jgi:hypothetical protein
LLAEAVAILLQQLDDIYFMYVSWRYYNEETDNSTEVHDGSSANTARPAFPINKMTAWQRIHPPENINPIRRAS